MNPPPLPPPPFAPRARRPWCTYVLLACNIAVFVGMSWSAKTEKFTFDYLAHDKNAVNAGEYWRLLTSTFVHPVFFHLALNMLVHVQIGRVLERVLGSGRYLVLYLLSGLSGAFLFQILAEPGLGMGASGAVYGEAAALLLAAFGRRVDGDLRLRPKFLAVAAVCILGDQVVALVWEHFEKGMRIAVSAHLGGFVGGTLLGFAMVPRPPAILGRTVPARAAASVVFAVLFIAAGVYGCFYSRHDAGWQGLELLLKLEKNAGSQSPESVVDAWRKITVPADGPDAEVLKRHFGYLLVDQLLAIGREDSAHALLDELIEQSEAALNVALKQQANGGPNVEPELLNEVAWYYAMRRTDLVHALDLSRQSVELVDETLPRGFWRWLPSSREKLLQRSMYVNTHGWLLFELGKSDEALQDLKMATELAPAGPNFLYYSLALDRLGHEKEARAAAEKATRAGGLSPNEKRLLEDLRESIGGF